MKSTSTPTRSHRRRLASLVVVGLALSLAGISVASNETSSLAMRCSKTPGGLYVCTAP